MMRYGLLRRGDPVPAQSSIIHYRSSMRKGFSLVEMLMVIMIAPIVMVAVSGVFRTFIRDIPQGIRLVQQNTTVLHLLAQIRQDMDLATGLPAQVNGRQAGDATLLIEQPAGVVCYQFENGRMVRTLLDGQGTSSPGEERVWQARDAVIGWRPWTRDGRVYAAELHSHVQQQVEGEVRRRLRGSYVFFVHGLSQGDKTL